jgi:hypothetical protein
MKIWDIGIKLVFRGERLHCVHLKIAIREKPSWTDESALDELAEFASFFVGEDSPRSRGQIRRPWFPIDVRLPSAVSVR